MSPYLAESLLLGILNVRLCLEATLQARHEFLVLLVVRKLSRHRPIVSGRLRAFHLYLLPAIAGSPLCLPKGKSLLEGIRAVLHGLELIPLVEIVARRVWLGGLGQAQLHRLLKVKAVPESAPFPCKIAFYADENPFKDGSAQKEQEMLLCCEHRNLAREIAAKSFVLLKNEKILPLAKGTEKTVALIGPYADHVEMFGAWSFPKKPELNSTIKTGAFVCGPVS